MCNQNKKKMTNKKGGMSEKSLSLRGKYSNSAGDLRSNAQSFACFFFVCVFVCFFWMLFCILYFVLCVLLECNMHKHTQFKRKTHNKKKIIHKKKM